MRTKTAALVVVLFLVGCLESNPQPSPLQEVHGTPVGMDATEQVPDLWNGGGVDALSPAADAIGGGDLEGEGDVLALDETSDMEGPLDLVEVDVCVPDCTDLECGDDGCGGSCGECEEGFFCEAGQCVEGEEPITLELVPGCNPFTSTDVCILPYPSLFYEESDADSPTGVRVHYPADAVPVGEGNPPFDMDPTNLADGVSPAGPILLHFGVDVAPEFLASMDNLAFSKAPDSPIALINLETGERVLFLAEMDMNRKESHPGRYALIIRPLEAMAMGQRHAVVLTNTLQDSEGNPLPSPPAFAALRDKTPTTNEEIEAVREHFEELFAFLGQQGYPRENLLLAWDFSVASKDFLLGSVLSMRTETLAEAGGTGLAYTITEVQEDPNDNLARLVKGEFEVPTFLQEDNTILYDEAHHPIRQYPNQTFPFTLIVPKMAYDREGPLPLVHFGHGIFGSGVSYLAGWAGKTTQALAQEFGVVMVATDWIGLSSGDKDLIINEVLTDLNRIGIVTDRLQQSLVNNLVLTELTLGQLGSDPAITVGEGPLLTAEQVYYYGVSLGGIQGTSFVALSPRITRGVLAVPGAVWLNMIPRSTVWTPIKAVMDILYPDPLAQQMGIAFIQTWFDHSDPLNLTWLLFDEPPADITHNRTVLFQEAINDSQVPNLATEMLARTRNIQLLQPSATEVHGLVGVESPTTDSALAQYLLENASSPAPPVENVPPASDNNVHADMVFLPHVIQQAIHFFESGEIVQFCDGACDPE